MAISLKTNLDLELAPPFTAVQTADGWIDGTATGSSTNTAYGWWASPRATAIAVSFDNTVSHSGSNSLKLSTTNTTGRARVFSCIASAGNITGNSTNDPYLIRAVPGGTYIFSAWVKTNNVASNSVLIEIVELNSSYSVGTSTASSMLTGTNGWTLLTVTATVASTCRFIAVDFQNATAGNVSDAWFDDATFTGPGYGSSFPVDQTFHPQTIPLPVWQSMMNRPSYQPLAPSGTAYSQSLSGTVSSTGFQTKAIGLPTSGSLSLSGSMDGKSIVAILSSALSFTGSLVRAMFLHTLLTAATLTLTGAHAKSPRKLLQATLELSNIVQNGTFENAPVSNVAMTTGANVWINGTAAGSSASAGYGWATISVTSSASAGFDSTQLRSGIYSMKLSTLNSTGQMTVGSFPSSPAVQNLFILQPSTQYQLTGWIKTSNVATNGAFIDMRQYNAALSTITTTSTNKLAGTNGWTQVSATITTNASAAFGNIFLRNNVAGNVSDAWFDDVTLVQLTPRNPFITIYRQLSATLSMAGNFTRIIPYRLAAALSFAGSFTKTILRPFTSSVSFSGAVTNSIVKVKALTASLSFSGASSRSNRKDMRASVSDNNVIPNAGFELTPDIITAPTNIVNRWIDGSAAGSIGVSNFSWATASLNGTAQAGFDSAISHSGSYSMKLSTLANTVDNIVVGNYRQTPSDGVLFRLTPGVSYTLTGWIKTNNVVSNGAFIDVREFDSGYSPITTTSSTKLSGTNNWTQVSFTFTAQNNTVFATIFLRNNIAGAISDVWFDDISLTVAASQFVKQVRRSLGATASFTGSIVRLPARALMATITFVGAQTRNIFKLLPGYLSFTVPPDQTDGGVGSGYIGGDPLGGGFGGSLGAGFTKRTSRSMTASGSFTGSATRRVGHTMIGGLSFTGGLLRRVLRSLAATVGFSGLLSEQTLRLISFTASITPAAQLIRLIRKSSSATMSPTGQLNRRSTRSFTASIGLVGTFIRRLQRNLSAVLSASGSSNAQSRKSFTATVSPTSSAVRRISRNMTASTNMQGVMLKMMSKSFSSSLSFTGLFGRIILKALVAAVGFIANLSPFAITRGSTTTKPTILGDNDLNSPAIMREGDSNRPTPADDDDQRTILM